MKTDAYLHLMWKEYRAIRAFWLSLAVLVLAIQFLTLSLISDAAFNLNLIYSLALGARGFFCAGRCWHCLCVGERRGHVRLFASGASLAATSARQQIGSHRSCHARDVRGACADRLAHLWRAIAGRTAAAWHVGSLAVGGGRSDCLGHLLLTAHGEAANGDLPGIGGGDANIARASLARIAATRQSVFPGALPRGRALALARGGDRRCGRRLLGTSMAARARNAAGRSTAPRAHSTLGGHSIRDEFGRLEPGQHTRNVKWSSRDFCPARPYARCECACDGNTGGNRDG